MHVHDNPGLLSLSHGRQIQSQMAIGNTTQRVRSHPGLRKTLMPFLHGIKRLTVHRLPLMHLLWFYFRTSGLEMRPFHVQSKGALF